MKRITLIILAVAAVVISCSKNNDGPINPDPKPVEPENVYFYVRKSVKVVPTHEKKYNTVLKEFEDKYYNLNGVKMPYDEFAKDSVAIFDNFVAKVSKLAEEYSGSYIYGSLSCSKSRNGFYKEYESRDIEVKSSKEAYVLYSEAIGRHKTIVKEDVQALTDLLDESGEMVTVADSAKISSRMDELILRHKSDLACGEIHLLNVYYIGQNAYTEVVRRWSLPKPKILYELHTGESKYQRCYSYAYDEAVKSIKFDHPMEFESEDAAVAYGEEVQKKLNGRFFGKEMSVMVSNDCFENSHHVKSVDIEMAGTIWGVAIDGKTDSQLRRKIIDGMVNLEKEDVCYLRGDWHPFKERIREICKTTVPDVKATLDIIQCNTSIFFPEPTKVDTLILR